MIGKLIAFAVIWMLMQPMGAYATTFYIANNPSSGNPGWGNGSNSNDGGSKASPFLTARYAWSKMKGGDTLIIDDGEYGVSSCYDSTFRMPQGNASDGYTVMRAENDGKVVINGNGEAVPFAVEGDDTVDGRAGYNSSQDYIEVRGIVFKNSSGSVIKVSHANHIKIINCGAVGSSGGSRFGIIVGYSTYVLVEGCYVWGGEGKYRIATYHADHTIVRNSVARIDKVMQASNGLGAFSIYSSTNVEVQNCIAIDSDTDNYWELGDMVGAFGAPTTSSTSKTGPINFRNCIALNNHLRFGSLEWNAYPADTHFTNCVGWDVKTRGTRDFIHSQGSSSFTNCTFGEVDTASGDSVTHAWFNGWKSGNSDSSSSNIFYKFLHGGLFYDVESSNNNNIFGLTNNYPINVNGSSVQNTKTYDPKANGLKYLVKIESGSQLEQDGIGASIIYQIGKSGTLWGEHGYNLLQNGSNGQELVRLWPFPHEDIIRDYMRSYSYDGGNLNGKRGFCADGKQLNGVDTISLTSYIWEYLGSPMPCIIYKESPKNLRF